ncbi:glycerol-3-phosphate dehydrogenase/oxidase [Pendulispora rubella]|uniref:Glycerol-3-phosphate dehydrogenase n=1 Tax=Pendulispora rubella TaxID=2741070 RepID=A0ABZ2LHC0_9BACT
MSDANGRNGMGVDDAAVDASYDVAVIGGGVNGTGVARDLSLRGLRVVLFERHDLAFGASGNSSGMIHGGARYLPTNPKVTRQSCQDSGYIQQIAPHLLFRIPFLMPVRAGARGRIMIELLDAFFRAYDRYQPLKRGELHTRLDGQELAHLEPGLHGDLVGGVTFDEWGVDGTRLCVLNALDAKERGAAVHVHTTVESLARGPGEPRRYVIRARDRLTQKAFAVEATNVVNATGAWGPITATLGKLPGERVRVRPAKGIHVVFDRRLSNYAILTEAIDGRQIFLEPWENMSVIGTTDDDFFGDLDDVVATSEEVRYLVQGVARVFPAIREARAIGTTAAVRPTLYEYGPNEDALSREHAIVDHAQDGAPGVYSMIGGKLASYRLFAEEMADRLAPGTTCSTHVKALPGGDAVPDALAVAEQNELTPVAARRLVYRHGSRAKRILQRMVRRPRERAVVCPCEPVFEAEVRHVLQEEMARSVDDVARRTRLGLGACGGMRCAARCGQIVADELGLAPHEGIEQARTFLEGRAKTRIVAMGPGQARQEALAMAHLRATIGSKGRT